MGDKLVSVIIAAYNAERYLRRCLDSILNQPYRRIEAMIMDDGSQDETLKIANEYATADSRVRVFSQRNCGPAEARNRLIDLSEGEYIAICDADDYNCKDRFVRQTEYLDANWNVDLVSGGLAKISAGGKVVFASKKRDFPENDQLILNGICNPVPHGGIMFRKSIIDRVDRPFYRKVIGEDLEMLARLLYAGCKFAYMDGFCYYYQLGSSLQENYDKNVIRDEERHVIAGLVRDGKILDYEESMRRYRAICVNNHSSYLRRLRFNMTRACYGVFANCIWSIYPRFLRHFLYDLCFSLRATKGSLYSYKDVEIINSEL